MQEMRKEKGAYLPRVCWKCLWKNGKFVKLLCTEITHLMKHIIDLRILSLHQFQDNHIGKFISGYQTEIRLNPQLEIRIIKMPLSEINVYKNKKIYIFKFLITKEFEAKILKRFILVYYTGKCQDGDNVQCQNQVSEVGIFPTLLVDNTLIHLYGKSIFQ